MGTTRLKPDKEKEEGKKGGVRMERSILGMKKRSPTAWLYKLGPTLPTPGSLRPAEVKLPLHLTHLWWNRMYMAVALYWVTVAMQIVRPILSALASKTKLRTITKRWLSIGFVIGAIISAIISAMVNRLPTSKPSWLVKKWSNTSNTSVAQVWLLLLLLSLLAMLPAEPR